MLSSQEGGKVIEMEGPFGTSLAPAHYLHSDDDHALVAFVYNFYQKMICLMTAFLVDVKKMKALKVDET